MPNSAKGVHGERRWRDSPGRRLLTWDSLHGEIEAFDLHGRHSAVLDAVSGVPIKEGGRGRRIRV
ncbi:colicin E3/pyocin S6 family cytotoxin [Rhodopila globiformis]|jgi:hypothetical protein|uniref:Colicin E3-like ribonuclease domain-containing protein n=1 Tax=Rhodopila globiformis TaxID=1071 RepID=A0A2S6NKH2_RHOGL|nr:hypothetical protein CCS01_07200 [Rhodopila globiformis]